MKEKYKPGMIFRSKEHPEKDIKITFVCYWRGDTADECNIFSLIDWCIANEEAFDKFVCEKKGYDYSPAADRRMDFSNKTTFPYPSWGEMKPRSMDQYIRKYGLVLSEEADEKDIAVYADNDGEYSAGLRKE